MAKVTAETLESTLKNILSDYAESIQSDIQEVIKKVAKTGVTALKNSSPRSKGSPSFGKKHYANQWAVKEEIDRLSASEIIYNKTPTYRLAHLLENGYAKRNGGRVAGRPHIKPVEKQLIDTVEKDIKRKIER